MAAGGYHFPRQAAALLEAAQTAKSQEAEELTQRALDLIALVDELAQMTDFSGFRSFGVSPSLAWRSARYYFDGYQPEV